MRELMKIKEWYVDKYNLYNNRAYAIVAETEKAYKVIINSIRWQQLWIPKSVCELVEEDEYHHFTYPLEYINKVCSEDFTPYMLWKIDMSSFR